MKILYINTLYSPMVMGGAEISIKLLVEGIQASGMEVAVLCLSPGKGLTSDTVDGVKVYRAGLKNIYWPYTTQHPPAIARLAWHVVDHHNAAMKAYVRQVMALEKPDVVSCHNLAGWSAAVWGEVKSHDVPLIQVLHDLYLLCANSNMHKGGVACEKQCMRCKIFRAGHASRSRQVDAVVGISKSILDRFAHAGYFAEAQQHVIHNARAIATTGKPRQRLAGQPVRVGYLGTLSRIKGVEWLVTSFKSLAIDATLHIAGKGREGYVKKLQQLADDERIEFAGYVSAADFLNTVDVLVVPSLWQEPLGMVVIEAMAHHVPVIANRVGGMQETVIDEVNGLFCDDKEPDSLRMAIERLYHDVALYNKLSASARSSVAGILDTNRMINAYKKVVESVTQTIEI
jgi:glycosyltransferase involved in cell wall biosynthesis